MSKDCRPLRTHLEVLAAVTLVWLIAPFVATHATAQTRRNPPVDESKLRDEKKPLTEVDKELNVIKLERLPTRIAVPP